MQIPLPNQPKIIKKEGNEAVIEVSSLYPGYGTTLGNAIRRILLSSLPGAAITSVKIEGADHEFTTFPNLKEDVIHILLNLKQIRFKLHRPEPATITLTSKGEGEVKASDFKVSPDVEIINPDQYLATLTDKKATLNIEADVSPGLGYEPVERQQKDKLPIGRIALDAIYTPIRKANFRVENMRVGDRTDFNRLLIEIETDGTLSPEAAYEKAVEILKQHIEAVEKLEHEASK